MITVEVNIKVTSTTLAEYLNVKSKLENFTGEQIGQNPVKETLQQDEVNFVNEVKITAEAVAEE